MKTIGISEATTSLSQLVDQALSGEEVLLTRHGKPIARLAPLAGENKQAASMDWLAQSCAARMSNGRSGA